MGLPPFQFLKAVLLFNHQFTPFALFPQPIPLIFPLITAFTLFPLFSHPLFSHVFSLTIEHLHLTSCPPIAPTPIPLPLQLTLTSTINHLNHPYQNPFDLKASFSLGFSFFTFPFASNEDFQLSLLLVQVSSSLVFFSEDALKTPILPFIPLLLAASSEFHPRSLHCFQLSHYEDSSQIALLSPLLYYAMVFVISVKDFFAFAKSVSV
jgi:hypothetical protein